MGLGGCKFTDALGGRQRAANVIGVAYIGANSCKILVGSLLSHFAHWVQDYGVRWINA